MYQNPFINSDDNLRYFSYSYYLKQKYHTKVCKVPLDAGFTCPNRDGTKGYHGCAFCSARGSGDFVEKPQDHLFQQYEDGLKIMRRKWPDALGIAYFQAYSNTYASLDTLKKIYTPFIENKDIVELSIATRPDCLDDEKIEFFSLIQNTKPITIELGLQSIHDSTMDQLNRHHSSQELIDMVHKLKEKNIRVTLHIINGLPYETEEMMLTTAQEVAKLKVNGIKIHMLNILKNTALYQNYRNNEFTLLTLKEYVDIVVKQLEILPPDMVIERLTGDGLFDQLIAPAWIQKKTIVLNEITKLQKARNTWQGKNYHETDER